MGLLGQPGDQDLVCHLILAQFPFGIYESSRQNAQEAHNLGDDEPLSKIEQKEVNTDAELIHED